MRTAGGLRLYGRYGNASEVVREGLRLMERQKQEDRAKLKFLREAVREGLNQIDRGEGPDFRSIDDLEKHIDQLGREASPVADRKKEACLSILSDCESYCLRPRKATSGTC